MAHSPRPRKASLLRRISHLDAHHRVFTSAGVAVLGFVLAPWHWHATTRMLITWNTFALTNLSLAWLSLYNANPARVARIARLQDSSRSALFAFVIVAACASIFAVAMELGTAKGLDRAHASGHVVFSLMTVLTSWLLVHTVFTLRYAHIFYGVGLEGDAPGGLNFPEECSPDYLDFAYFSFVIGMTSQVSDVTIGSQRMRRLALLHGLISFVFNLSILGLCINTLSGLF